MNRPELKAVSISPNPVNTKATISVTIDVEDVLIVFGTDYKYARASSYEAYAGEDGLI